MQPSTSWRCLLLFALALGASACDLREAPTFVRWPNERSSTFVVVDLGAPPIVRVGEGRAPLNLVDVERVYLLQYDASVAELGLSLGAFTPGQPCQPCALLGPDQIYSLGGDPPAWTELGGLPDEVRTQLVPDAELRCNEACPALTRVLEAAPWSSPILASARFDGGLILGELDGGLYRVDRDGQARSLCRLAASSIAAVAVREPGELWVATPDALLSLDIDDQEADRACTTLTATRAPGTFRAMAVSPSPLPFELVAAGVDRRVYAYDGSAFRHLATLEQVDAVGGGAVWLGEREFAVSVGSPQFALVSEGVARLVDLPPRTVPTAVPSVTGLGWHSTLGLLVAAEGLGLLKWSDRSVLVPPEGGTAGLVVSEVELAVLDRLGAPHRYHLPSQTSCPAISFYSDHKSRAGMFLPDRGLYVADARDPEPVAPEPAARFKPTSDCLPR